MLFLLTLPTIGLSPCVLLLPQVWPFRVNSISFKNSTMFYFFPRFLRFLLLFEPISSPFPPQLQVPTYFLHLLVQLECTINASLNFVNRQYCAEVGIAQVPQNITSHQTT